MPRTRPPYPEEFRRQMVELVRTGRTPEELAREFEPCGETIRNWIKKKEMRELRREVRQLRVEREILKKPQPGKLALLPSGADRDFKVSAPDRLWVPADMGTYVPTAAGFFYLSVVLDAWSWRVVGWSMATHLKTEFVLDALKMAIHQRRPDGVVHHSDQGTQDTFLAFGKRCREEGVRLSMGSVGDAYDNALCESFFVSLECELIDRVSLTSFTHGRRKVFDYIEGWYNPHRRHSSLNYESPIRYEWRSPIAA